MAITAIQIESSNSLEQFRQEFNNLQSDVSGLETGTISFAAITTTSSNTTTLNVKEDGTIIFEGATDDGFETTLTVEDPTADRVITFPNESGTVFLSTTASNSLITGQTTIASGAVATGADELLLSDASAGTFKRVTVDNIFSSVGGLASVAGDSSPQLGANLDTNSFNILIDDAHFIGDENGNEQIIFQTTGSAVNQFDITNAASGSPPRLSSTGGDTNIDLELLAKGNGHITVYGNGVSGSIQFNCQSNSHGQMIRAQPHSAGATNIMLLPEGADSTLVSLVSADTLTNKTLTTPTLTGTSIVASLDISGDIDVDGTTNLDVVDIDGAVNMATTATITGNLTLGAQLIMPDVTSTKILVADGTSFQEVAISGDVTIANTGAVTIAATSVEGSMLNNNVISGQTALTSGLATTDELLVSDGGTLKRMDVSVLTALTDASSADSAVALAIALG